MKPVPESRITLEHTGVVKPQGLSVSFRVDAGMGGERWGMDDEPNRPPEPVCTKLECAGLATILKTSVANKWAQTHDVANLYI